MLKAAFHLAGVVTGRISGMSHENSAHIAAVHWALLYRGKTNPIHCHTARICLQSTAPMIHHNQLLHPSLHLGVQLGDAPAQFAIQVELLTAPHVVAPLNDRLLKLRPVHLAERHSLRVVVEG
jgi:hypothetical protein